MKFRSQMHDNVRLFLLVALYATALGAILHIGKCPLAGFFLGTVLYILLVIITSTHPTPKQPPNRRFLKILNLTIIAASVISCVVILAPAAQGQFYRTAEAFAVSCFSAASVAIPLLFNILRLLFVIYLGVSLIQTINAVREGQSLIGIATPPMIVIAVLTIGDILSTLIVGGVTC